MAGLIVGLAVMAVLMTAAMPVWKHTVQREKEEELVFRGEQYAHAIGMFQRKTANAYPPTLDVLVQQKFLRKKYKDPVTNDDFVPLTQATQAAQRGAQPGQSAQTQQGRGGAAAPGAATPQAGVPAGGIIGVTSKSTDESIRLYKGRSHYNEWAFIYTPPAQAAGAGGSWRSHGARRGRRRTRRTTARTAAWWRRWISWPRPTRLAARRGRPRTLGHLPTGATRRRWTLIRTRR